MGANTSNSTAAIPMTVKASPAFEFIKDSDHMTSFYFIDSEVSCRGRYSCRVEPYSFDPYLFLSWVASELGIRLPKKLSG